MLPCNSSDSSDWLKICLYKYGACPSIKSCMKQYLIFNCNYHSMKCRNKQSCQVQPWSLFPIREQAANSRFPFCRKLPQRYFWISNWSLMIPLDELSRSHFVIFEIPVSSSGIYNAKSSRLALVQVAPQNFIPTWDKVVSDHWHFRYLWANCPQDFPTICREVDCHTSHK